MSILTLCGGLPILRLNVKYKSWDGFRRKECQILSFQPMFFIRHFGRLLLRWQFFWCQRQFFGELAEVECMEKNLV